MMEGCVIRWPKSIDAYECFLSSAFVYFSFIYNLSFSEKVHPENSLISDY